MPMAGGGRLTTCRDSDACEARAYGRLLRDRYRDASKQAQRIEQPISSGDTKNKLFIILPVVIVGIRPGR